MSEAEGNEDGIGNCVRLAFEILIHLLTLDIPVALQEHIFQDALKAAKSDQYDDFDFNDNWLEVVVAATHDHHSENQALALLDTLLEASHNRKDEWYRTAEMQGLINHKLTLLRKTGREKEAEEIRLQFLHLPQIRQELITEKIAEKNYAAAKELIQEGIGIVNAKGWLGIVYEYKKTLLQIARQENDIAGIRNIAGEFYEKSHHMEYYKLIKSTYNKKEWPAVAAAFIHEIQMQHASVAGVYFNDNSRLADIFVEEKYWEQLLQIIQSSKDLSFVDRYSSWLTAKYPDDTLQVYKKMLTAYAAQHIGRGHYVTIREQLKKMQHWDGGKAVVKALVAQFTQLYKTRRAMLEELAKINL